MAGPGDGTGPAPPQLSATERTRHRRLREQGRAAREDLFAVLAAGLVAHLGVIVDGVPMVVPTSYGFDEHRLYLHGSVASQSLADRRDGGVRHRDAGRRPGAGPVGIRARDQPPEQTFGIDHDRSICCLGNK